ncbi:MAG: glycosyltransferase [Bacillota bacterium]
MHHAADVKNGPLVSIVIAAKDEEEHITKTLSYLAMQDYKNLEIIVVNDRSNDKTGDVIDKFKSTFSNAGKRLKCIHIDDLPKGWAGKNHALYQGYLNSRGEFIIFTDADIVFEEEMISKTISYVHDHHVEHLTVLPRIIYNSYPLKSFIHVFLLTFCIFLQPWKVFIKGKKGKGIGVGAFNLIKRGTYEKLGTHKAFPMNPIDDIELGKRAHAISCNQHFVIGKELLSVEWYPNLPVAIKGFEKNFFASVGYKIENVIVLSILKILYGVYPFIGIFLFDGVLWYVHVLCLSLLFTFYIICINKFSYLSWYELLLLPFSILCYIYTLVRSMYFVLKGGGVQWRGTFYPLQELRSTINKDNQI